MIFTSFAVAFVFLGLSQAKQASSFDVPLEVGQKYGCGAECLAALSQGNAVDLKTFGTSFDFNFYATASNFSNASPGDVLKIQPVNSTTISINQAQSVYKMQYTSVDLDGSLAPATSFIAFPFAQGNNPFETVAFAHGTSGLFRGCTPSTSPGLIGIEAWAPLLLEGHAIVAADYAGLGNNYTTHKYVAHAAAANDLIYAVKAAQKAFPKQLTHEWVSLGHSQGGSAVWKLSEHKLVQDRQSGYLGGVAMAPAAPKIFDLIQGGLALAQNSTGDAVMALLGSVTSPIMALKRVFPEYEPTWLADAMKQRLGLLPIGQYCGTAIGLLATGLTLNDVIATFDVSNDTYIHEFQNMNAPGQGDKAKTPLLITHGLADPLVPAEGTISTFAETCKNGNAVRLSLYPGLAHSAIIEGSAPEWMQFIRERFAHAPFQSACSRSVAKPFDLKHAKSPLDTDERSVM